MRKGKILDWMVSSMSSIELYQDYLNRETTRNIDEKLIEELTEKLFACIPSSLVERMKQNYTESHKIYSEVILCPGLRDIKDIHDQNFYAGILKRVLRCYISCTYDYTGWSIRYNYGYFYISFAPLKYQQQKLAQTWFERVKNKLFKTRDNKP
jgi:hypothetical protein